MIGTNWVIQLDKNEVPFRIKPDHMDKKNLVIVGGGFAGLQLAKKLANHPSFQIILVDRNNYHFFPPLLYQVATAFIEPSNISYPFRKMFQGKQNIRFHLGSLVEVNQSTNELITDTGTLSFDYLVLAMGTETNFFGMDSVAQKSLPMKTIDEALELRNTLLMNIEKAIRTTDAQEKLQYLNIVIAGGGPTGVELAGMLAEMGKNIGAKDYPEITNLHSNIFLVDAGKSLLGAMSEKSGKEAFQTLKKLGVSIKLNTAVQDFDGKTVVLSDGSQIPSATLIWSSGVVARQVPGVQPDQIGRGRRLLVDAYNRLQGSENIFVLGDQCLQKSDPAFPEGHPQVAQVAIQQGELLAKNLLNGLSGKDYQAFQYRDKGSMAIISKFRAVVDLPKGFFKGAFAWLVWLFIHIIPIAGFRNKAKIAYNWFWSFITNDPTLRLIIRPKRKNI